MSYVLEALRRAEAERHRGRVPGLDAQPLPAPQAGLAAAGPKRRPGWALAGLALAAGAGLVAWLAWPGAPSPPAAVPPAAPVAAVPPAPAVVVRPAPPLAPSLASPPVVRAPVPRPAPAASEPGPAAGRIVRLQDLPESTRRQLPPLVFGGATDSPEAGARMLIINGQIWREGDEPAPGLKLERITLRAAQFRWRGQRFEAGY
jgi:general secretion pathway protein B